MQPRDVESSRAGHNAERHIRFELVSTPQHWLHATAIRSICFLEEHDAKAELVFDGNDYMATHALAYDGDEPIGTARIRWFKDFAKIERMSLRKPYRGMPVVKNFAWFLFDHIARKGYTRVITHAGAKYARLWKSLLGFQNSGKEPYRYEGQEPFYEIWKDLQPVLDAISLESSGVVLSRTEGAWDEPSIFER